MSLSSATVWEVRPAGSGASDNNGGGFVAGASGSDFSQQDAAQYSGTNLVIDAATNTKVTSASHSFVAADVGNLIQITAGTGFTTGFYQVMSVASGAATLDRSAGTLGSTGGTWALGGALASPGKAGGAHVAGNTVWVQAGTYLLTSSTVNGAGGVVSIQGQASLTAWTFWEGYATVRGDTGTPPILRVSGITGVTLLLVNGSGTRVRNLELDGANGASVQGIKIGGNLSFAILDLCRVRNCPNIGINVFTGLAVVRGCEISGCGTAGVSGGANSSWNTPIIGCYAHDNTGPGFSGGLTYNNCIARNNTGAASDGFFGPAAAINCTAVGNGRSGFRPDHNQAKQLVILQNCLAVDNSEYGFNGHGSIAAQFTHMFNCAAYHNTSGAYNAAALTVPPQSFVTLTADPFANSAGGDLSLNSTTGGGAALRGTGWPGAFPGGLTTGYLDIGAAQHADAGGGGGTPRRVWG